MDAVTEFAQVSSKVLRGSSPLKGSVCKAL